MVIGYASGVFDLFHMGHLNILRRARMQCDYLIAGVLCDSEVARHKNRRAAQDQDERMEILSSVRFVDQVYLDRHALDKTLAWYDLRFNIVFKGDDWKGAPKGQELERALAEIGNATVTYLPYTTLTSTTRVRSLLGMA